MDTAQCWLLRHSHASAGIKQTQNIIEKTVIKLTDFFPSDSEDREEDTYLFYFNDSLEYFTRTDVIEGLASFTSD